MLKTLHEWYSLQNLTKEQYYRLLGLVEAEKKYALDELQLLAELPSTEQLKPFGKRNLTNYHEAVKDWDTYQPQFDYVSVIVLVVMVIVAVKMWTN